MLTSNGIQLIFTFAAGVMLARGLGTADFGWFNVLISVITLAGAISDFGLTASATYQIPKILRQNATSGVSLGRAYFWLRVLLGGLTTSILISVTFLLPAQWWPADLPIFLLQIAFLGVVAHAVNDAGKTFLQIDARFYRYSLLTILGALLTLSIVLVLSIMGMLNLANAVIYLMLLQELLMFGIIYWMLSGRWSLSLPASSNLTHAWLRLFRSGRWLWLSNMFEKAGSRLDLLLIPLWLSSPQVGVYALALNLSRRLESVNHHLYTVVLPKTADLHQPRVRNRFIQRSMWRSTLIGVGILGCIGLSGYLIPLIYGSAYHSSVTLFQALALIVIIEVYVTPFSLLFHSGEDEHEKTAAEGIKALLLLIFLPIFIPIYGWWGAVISRFIATMGYGLFVMYRTKRSQNEIEGP